MGYGSGVEVLLYHSHVTEDIVPLSPLVPDGHQEVEEEAEEADGDIDQVVPECTGVACESPEGVSVDCFP